MSASDRRTSVCIAGGGPAGLMLGLLLARAGVAVTVLEKHSDFLRDFRGDTIHPTTMDLLEQLALTEAFEAIEHTAVRTLDSVIHGVRITAVDFGALQGGHGRLRFMPQWDLLNLLKDAAAQEPSFTLMMNTAVTGLVREGGRVVGVTARSANGTSGDGDQVTIRADLTVAADGRASVLREASGLEVKRYGVPIDVLWFRLDRPPVDPPPTIAYLSTDGVVITVPRSGYYQVALLIEKGSWDQFRARGLAAFRNTIAQIVPFLVEPLAGLQGWDELQLLSVQIDRLQKWYLPGFLAIGDAAHAMSPAFGIGINYAIQDAVATANLLARPLRDGVLTENHLAAIQRRRYPPTRRMQAVQRVVNRFVGRPGDGGHLPNPAILSRAAPLVARLTRPLLGRLVGRGFRPETIAAHILDPTWDNPRTSCT
ncbi:2-polyprenyl-6-methoxyphenol hydroxylase-like FAD-dependent oxidoreductase [Nakamurella sp. UYEF19]|uniref:FAD-dependent oxidoreductase n=1 Tax=Nakamurella sp. UYEF19 TaxID=1756392 RepID=UPI00339A637F